MKAFVYALDQPKKMKLVTDRPIPEASKDEVKVKVTVSSLNPVDYKVPEISAYASSRKDTPVGVDFAGSIAAVGSSVKDFAVGDVVYGTTMKGTLAEFLTVKASTVGKVPTQVDLKEAAAAPCAALTAYQGLQIVGAINAKAPLKILIIGASGGVGHYAVQIAKACNPTGTKVLAVCSGKNSAFVKGLGADKILDYTEIGFDLPTAVTDADVVYDCVTPDTPYEEVSKKCLKPSGKYVCANSSHMSDFLRKIVSGYLPFSIERGNFNLVMVNSNTKDLTALAELMSKKKVKSHISKTISMKEDELHAAYDLLKSHRTVGKIIVTF